MMIRNKQETDFDKKSIADEIGCGGNRLPRHVVLLRGTSVSILARHLAETCHCIRNEPADTPI